MVFAFHFYSFFMLGLCFVGAFGDRPVRCRTCAGNTDGGRVGEGTDVAFDRDFDRMAVFRVATILRVRRRFRVATSVGSRNMHLPLMILYRWFLFYATLWPL